MLRVPFPGQEALRAEVLFSGHRWVALPSGHRLALHEEVAFRDLWDEPFVAAAAESGRWRDDWLATDGREGHPVRVGAVADQPDAWLGAIANAYGVALASASAARFHSRRGVTYRLVKRVGPSRVAVARAPAADADAVVQDFVRCCRQGVREGGPTRPDSAVPGAVAESYRALAGQFPSKGD